MGTRVAVGLRADSPLAAEQLLDAAMAEFDRIERLMSTYIDSSRISEINRDAAERPVDAGRELAGLIRRALTFSELTDGAFDITYESVGHHYDFRAATRPDDKRIAESLPLVDYRHVVVDDDTHEVQFLQSGVRINLGGIAKGYAVERVAALLKGSGVPAAMVTAGGDTRIVGTRRNGPWVVGIRNPRDRDAIAVRLPLADEALSTSGDYERYFETDGERVHHILSPSTGRSATGVRSASVIGPDATTTDALSTAVFVLGVAAGIDLVERLPGIEAVVIDADQRLHFSSGLAEPGRPAP